MGAYHPLASTSRGGDCFSGWFDWGKEVIPFHKYFDRDFVVSVENIALLSIRGVWFVYLTYYWIDTCVPELRYNKENPWHLDYGFMSNDVRVQQNFGEGIGDSEETADPAEST